MSMVHCRGCGKEIHETAVTCPHCGAQQAVASVSAVDASDKRKVPAALLCWFLGVFGAHRFYVGKVGTAILMIFTLGGLGIWALVDLIMILMGSFTDKQGRKLVIN